MDLINMKETDEDGPQPTYEQDADSYPCGLCLTLDDDDLKKLGIETLPPLGSILSLEAKVKVTRLADDSGFYGRIRNLGLQITDMNLSSSDKSESDAY